MNFSVNEAVVVRISFRTLRYVVENPKRLESMFDRLISAKLLTSAFEDFDGEFSIDRGYRCYECGKLSKRQSLGLVETGNLICPRCKGLLNSIMHNYGPKSWIEIDRFAVKVSFPKNFLDYYNPYLQAKSMNWGCVAVFALGEFVEENADMLSDIYGQHMPECQNTLTITMRIN